MLARELVGIAFEEVSEARPGATVWNCLLKPESEWTTLCCRTLLLERERMMGLVLLGDRVENGSYLASLLGDCLLDNSFVKVGLAAAISLSIRTYRPPQQYRQYQQYAPDVTSTKVTVIFQTSPNRYCRPLR